MELHRCAAPGELRKLGTAAESDPRGIASVNSEVEALQRMYSNEEMHQETSDVWSIHNTVKKASSNQLLLFKRQWLCSTIGVFLQRRNREVEL